MNSQITFQRIRPERGLRVSAAFPGRKLVRTGILKRTPDKIFRDQGGFPGTGAAVEENACLIPGTQGIFQRLLDMIANVALAHGPAHVKGHRRRHILRCLGGQQDSADHSPHQHHPLRQGVTNRLPFVQRPASENGGGFIVPSAPLFVNFGAC